MSDIIDINVGETIEEVTINVVDNLITVNINKVTGGGGSQTLQQVTDEGNVTTNIIRVVDAGESETNLEYLGVNFNDLSDGGSTYLQFQNTSIPNQVVEIRPLSGTMALTSDIPDTSTLVPYTGATTDVDLGEFELKAGQVEFDQTPTGTAGVGVMRWNDTDGTLDLGLKGGNVTLQIGQEQVVRVVNKTATNVNLLQANYQAVRVTGAQGQRLKVDLAQATNDFLSAETIGLVTETINNNQEGFITTNGLVRGINTTGSLQGETWVDGDIVYLSATTAGNITNVKPLAPNHLVIIGYVVSAHITQGSIFVKVDVGYELDELHNVYISSVANNQILTYESATQLWKNKNLNQIVSERRNANNSSNNNINYCGTAPNGSAESSAVWTIKRLTIAASGSITIATATNVAWTNRESETYI